MNIKRIINVVGLLTIVLSVSLSFRAQTPPDPIPSGSGSDLTYVAQHRTSDGNVDIGTKTTTQDGTQIINYQDGWTWVIEKTDSGGYRETLTDANNRVMEEDERGPKTGTGSFETYPLLVHCIRNGDHFYRYVYDQKTGKVKWHSDEQSTYDAQGRLTVTSRSYYDSNNKLVSGEQFTREYKDDNDTNPIIIHGTLDSTTGKFVTDTPKSVIDAERKKKEEQKSTEQQAPSGEQGDRSHVGQTPRWYFDYTYAIMSQTAPPTFTEDTEKTPDPPKNEPGYNSKTSSDSGLDKTTFSLPNGSSIVVNLPTDTALGDTITGTVQIVPSGKTEAEQAANTGELSGTVTVEVGGRQTSVADKTFSRIISATPSAEDLLVSVFVKGKRVASTWMPVSPVPTSMPTQTSLPTVAQQGKPVEITHTGNGAFSPSNYVKLGGTQLPVLASNPRSSIYLNTSKTLGPSEIESSQGGVITRGPVSNVGVELSAKKLNLLRSETTELLAKGIGFNGIKEPVPYTLVVTPPSGIINMSGGNFQQGLIQPSQVQPDGTVSMTRMLTGITPGVWGITFTVMPPKHPFPAKRGDEDKKSITGPKPAQPSGGGSSGSPTGTPQTNGQGGGDQKGTNTPTTVTKEGKDFSPAWWAYFSGADPNAVFGGMIDTDPTEYKLIENWLTTRHNAEEQKEVERKARYEAEKANNRAKMAKAAADKDPGNNTLSKAAEDSQKQADEAKKKAADEKEKLNVANKALKEAESQVDKGVRQKIEELEKNNPQNDKPTQEKVDEKTLTPKKPE